MEYIFYLGFFLLGWMLSKLDVKRSDFTSPEKLEALVSRSFQAGVKYGAFQALKEMNKDKDHDNGN